MLKIGITGGIGSGKSTCCLIFECLDVPVYYADERAKYLMIHDKILKHKIKKLLGNGAYYKNGRINRKYIAQQIFHNKSLLKDINQLVHPVVKQDTITWFDNLPPGDYALKEAALLIESGSYQMLDKLIVVSSPLELRIKRIMKRDGIGRDDIIKRLQSQMDDQERILKADYVILNDTKQSLIRQILKIHNLLSQK